MRIGLYGISGVYNFGCEAIVRGAYNFIGTIYPESEIIYLSYSPDYDKKALADLDLEVYPIIQKRTITKRLINKLLKIFDINYRWLMFDVNYVIDKVDMIFSIGGDIYTIPQVLREQKTYPYYNSLVDFCDRVIKRGKQVIVYGASIGPWGSYKKAIDYNVKALSKYRAILCRDEETIEYLSGLGFKNTFFFPDPAFQIKGEKENVQKKYIGVNFSPLAFNEVYGNHDIIHIKKVAVLLDLIYEKYKIGIMFIPHVLSKNDNDNDFYFSEKIKNCMKFKDQVTTADTYKGFIGLKEYISACHVVIAARMHCAINAIDENIPTIFISYSQKSVGMCKYVYGNERMLVDIQKINFDLLRVLDEALCNEKEVIKILKIRNEEIQDYYEHNMDYIKKLLI